MAALSSAGALIAKGEIVRKARTIVLAVTVALLVCAVRWFVRTANGGKGYEREPRPRSVEAHPLRLHER
jgi:hypothetical protein